MQQLTVGTYNLNNLFSRFSFKADYAQVKSPEATQDITTKKERVVTFGPDQYVFRTYQGHLVRGKSKAERQKVAARIRAMNVDVLAVQEVEDLDTLEYFVRSDLKGLYPHVVLVEGNDRRLIDVGLLSKREIGAVRSWRFAEHPSESGPIFSRDLLEVEILSDDRKDVLLTVFNTHLKSHFVPRGSKNPIQEKLASDARRLHQVETIREIIDARVADGRPFVVLGDMNDPPGAPSLRPLAAGNRLHNALANAKPTATLPNAPSTPWTHRFKEAHQPPVYEQLDQIWVPDGIQVVNAKVLRRRTLTRDGSDHDPAWITIRL